MDHSPECSKYSASINKELDVLPKASHQKPGPLINAKVAKPIWKQAIAA